MPSFTVPVTDTVPSDYVGGNDRFYPSQAAIRRCWARFRQPGRAMNVYKLTTLGSSQNGGATHVDDGPTGAGQPYDWPNQGDVIAYTYYGARGPYEVSSAEAALLTAAGYGEGVA